MPNNSSDRRSGRPVRAHSVHRRHRTVPRSRRTRMPSRETTSTAIIQWLTSIPKMIYKYCHSTVKLKTAFLL
jgi:hypothetical protein